MINYNGAIVAAEGTIDFNNRAFKYGDALFETLKVENEAILFLEDHYFRLMASMRMLRMEIPMNFTLEYFEAEILKTINANSGTENRVRVTVFRDAEGLYCPNGHEVSFIMECAKVVVEAKEQYEVELYKDFTVNKSLLSTVKTNNRILNVLASIYAKENQLDNCILMNDDKNVVEFTNGNIFIVTENTITTPPLSDGCIKGVARKNIIDLIKKQTTYTLVEESFSPFALQKASEVFLTNVMVGVQPVYQYKKKQYSPKVSLEIQALLASLS